MSIFWPSTWNMTWHSISHMPDSLSDSLSDIYSHIFRCFCSPCNLACDLACYLAFYVAFHPTFYLIDILGLFAILCGISSWMGCGSGAPHRADKITIKVRKLANKLAIMLKWLAAGLVRSLVPSFFSGALLKTGEHHLILILNTVQMFPKFV